MLLECDMDREYFDDQHEMDCDSFVRLTTTGAYDSVARFFSGEDDYVDINYHSEDDNGYRTD